MPLHRGLYGFHYLGEGHESVWRGPLKNVMVFIPLLEEAHAEGISFYHKIIGTEVLESACSRLLAFNQTQMVAGIKLFYHLLFI